jgi:hypothetical protein
MNKTTGFYNRKQCFSYHYQRAEAWEIKYNIITYIGSFVAAPQLKRLVAGFSTRRPGFKSGSIHVGFVVDKVALGQVFSEYFGFPCMPIFIPPISPKSPSPIIRGWYNRSVSGRSTQSPTPLIKKKTTYFFYNPVCCCFLYKAKDLSPLLVLLASNNFC